MSTLTNCRETSFIDKFCHETGIYIYLNVYVRQFWEEIFLEKETFTKDFVEKIKKVILC